MAFTFEARNAIKKSYRNVNQRDGSFRRTIRFCIYRKRFAGMRCHPSRTGHSASFARSLSHVLGRITAHAPSRICVNPMMINSLMWARAVWARFGSYLYQHTHTIKKKEKKNPSDPICHRARARGHGRGRQRLQSSANIERFPFPF